MEDNPSQIVRETAECDSGISRVRGNTPERSGSNTGPRNGRSVRLGSLLVLNDPSWT